MAGNRLDSACEPGYYIAGMIITYGLTLMVVIPAFLVSLLLADWKALS